MSVLSVSRRNLVAGTVIAAGTAALAVTGSAALSLPVWAMFAGWLACFVLGLTTRRAVVTLACVAVGCVVLPDLLVDDAARLVGAGVIGALAGSVAHAAQAFIARPDVRG